MDCEDPDGQGGRRKALKLKRWKKALSHPIHTTGTVYRLAVVKLLEMGVADLPFWWRFRREFGLTNDEIRGWLEEAQVLESQLEERWKEFEWRPHSAHLERSCREVLYLLVRSQQPGKIVETGVANGASSFILLSALQRNGKGRLWSFEVPGENYHTPPGKEVGWLVPPDLAKGWQLLREESLKGLPRLFCELGEVDLFIHDSLHTYEVMRAEYDLAWPHLDRGRVLASDDVNFNKAFFEFFHEVGATPMVWRARLGILVKR